LLATACTQKKKTPAYKDPSAPVNRRVDDLLSRMTIRDKLSFLGPFSDTSSAGELPKSRIGFLNINDDARQSASRYNAIQRYFVEKTRLGIPVIKSGEGIFAYMGNGSTSFPQPIAMACSWDSSLMGQVASALGEEMKARGITQVLSPVVNLARDPRWGRTGETYGEDPYLASVMGVAYCKAMYNKGFITTPKHFVANSGFDGRFGAPVFFSEHYLREYFFPPFKACFQQGKAGSVMMAYNTIDGLICAENKWLMEDVLRNEWGFKGYVLSDGGALGLAYNGFDIAPNKENLVARVINAGCDFTDFNGEPLQKAYDDGLVTEERLDSSIMRELRELYRTGRFDKPFVDPDYAAKINNSPEHRILSRRVAEKSLVLLKNDNHTLPFTKEVKSVAVVGPMADWLLINHYGGWGRKEITIREGLEKHLPGTVIDYVKGANLLTMELPAIQPGNFVGSIRAEYFENPDLKGKPVYTGTVRKIEFDWKDGSPQNLPSDKFSIRYTGKFMAPESGNFHIGLSADDGARLFLNGNEIIDMWHNGGRRMKDTLVTLKKGQVYDFKLDYFDMAHNAVVQLGWDVNIYQDIPDAVQAARNADAVIVAVGMQDDENLDRADLDLDKGQEALIKAIAATGKPMVVVIQTGTVITMHDWLDKVPAVLQAWYPGEEGGNAIAEILFGDVNPSGKLSVSIPKTTGQVPIVYRHLPYKPADKYAVFGNDPEFPFGHGLSYTTFDYSDFSLSSKNISKTDSVNVNFRVTNSGERSGDEIVQLYIHDKVASLAQPVKKLVRFSRFSLDPGQSKKVTFTLYPDDLKIYDKDMNFVLEPGDFEIMAGSSSGDIRLKEVLTVE
ncbi:MAG TPA: glycoside hydrolase family 3 C-terminal domain-containing protein, partial [Bacteroidales bacterium]|nr:glycoside hydrolase family 3 C-terminal domain-containing protein [Bacteroidales bacterium]